MQNWMLGDDIVVVILEDEPSIENTQFYKKVELGIVIF